MKLSTRVRYGLRALTELAATGGEGPVMLDLIARRQGISRKYLDAIFARLKAGGIVTSTRGAGGGFHLARDPDTVTLLELYVTLEGPLNLVDCVSDDVRCDQKERCAAISIWRQLGKVMEDYLGSLTLADVVRMKRDVEVQASNMFFI
ncbi:MAG: Rrf2 family transcriptional regulator [Deltaproteobacteria bacterium]|nr:Rrf2 family transcriptional regulator [Deltaproteobacteria bacterium]